jgi:hypothetical protein
VSAKDLSGSGYDSVAGSCEHGNEHSASVNGWKFDHLSDCERTLPFIVIYFGDCSAWDFMLSRTLSIHRGR